MFDQVQWTVSRVNRGVKTAIRHSLSKKQYNRPDHSGETRTGHRQTSEISFGIYSSPRKEVLMFYSRRSLMVTLAVTAAALLGESVLHSEPQQSSPQPRPSPNTPDAAHPWGLSGPPNKPADSKAIDKQNQAEVRASVQKLYELITELKGQVEKSDANMTLSVSVVKKSQQIEKLAKHVKELAKG
jgi:hypothetical protein